VRAGLGVAVLPDWMIQVDLLSGRLERVLPQWNPKDVPVHVVYAGARSIADARARFRRLRRQLHEERIRIQGGAFVTRWR
jgi:DNA-binding transcriptional LysR family regulator